MGVEEIMESLNLPQFDPLPQRPEEEKEKEEPTIFHPRWKCFCCGDTGKIQAHLVWLLMPKYNSHRDKTPVCLRCTVFKTLIRVGSENFDFRFKPDICEKLDQFSRRDWQLTIERQSQIKKLVGRETLKLAAAKNLRLRDRTEGEDRDQQRKHEYIRINWDLDLKKQVVSEEN
jgi:hypothetical protein